jgi:hypothetical protein
MKTLITIIVLFSLSLGTSNTEKPEASEKKVIAYESFNTPMEFGFGNNFYLDADKDGESDFLFTTVFAGEEGNIHTMYVVNAIGDNQVLTVDNNAAVANEGNPMESFGNITWANAPAYILEQINDGKTNTWKGLWSGDRDQYVGIKLVKGDVSYTGWVKVFIDQNNDQAQVEGYAINKVSNSAINAGEK